MLLSAWPGGGPAVPDSEKSDFLVEEVRARVRARVRVRVRVRARDRDRDRATVTAAELPGLISMTSCTPSPG